MTAHHYHQSRVYTYYVLALTLMWCESHYINKYTNIFQISKKVTKKKP